MYCDCFICFFNRNFDKVGINTPNPAATLEVIAKNPTGVSTGVNGILIPRVDRARAQNMAAIPTSTMILLS